MFLFEEPKLETHLTTVSLIYLTTAALAKHFLEKLNITLRS